MEVQFVAVVGEGTEAHITGGNDIVCLHSHWFIDAAFECRIVGCHRGGLGEVLANDLCV